MGQINGPQVGPLSEAMGVFVVSFAEARVFYQPRPAAAHRRRLRLQILLGFCVAAMDAAVTSAAVAKQLASCNRATRDRALRLLRSWLSAQTTASAVSEEDLLKIWKGLFYCMWHADKLPVQAELVNRLASLLVSLEPSVSARYLEAFVVTIRREWSGIDHLRMDKFYLLVRRFLHHVFLLLSRNGWDRELSARMIGILSEKSLLAADKCQAQGVNYHITDIFLEEMKVFLPIAPEIAVELLNPFISVLESSSDKVLTNKIKRNLFGCLLENGRKYLDHLRVGEGDGVELVGDVDKLGKLALGLGLSGKFFQSASSGETVQGNRKGLFSLHEGFLKLEKDLENSGVTVSFLHENGGSEDAVVSAPSGATEHANGEMGSTEGSSDNASSKKRKKNKKASASGGKKSKPTKNGVIDSADVTMPSASASADGLTDNGENLAEIVNADGDVVSFDEMVMSNLQKQFEKVAAEAGLAIIGPGPGATPVATLKKRKKAKSADVQASKTNGSPGRTATVKNGDSSVKRVRFSLKNNLVWKPHSPLPPQSLRLPPSATPRGSALKKGVLPGPIKESPPTVKKAKMKANSVKKARKSTKSISPAVKRLRKLQSLSV